MAKGYRSSKILLTREQLFAALLHTDGGPVEIERTRVNGTGREHTYVRDQTCKDELRVLHVGLKGRVTSCEGAFP